MRNAQLPFACSYLPGRAKLHFLFWGGILMGLPLINQAGLLEFRVLATRAGSVEFLALLSSLALVIRWHSRNVEHGSSTIIFQEEERQDLLALKLNS